LNRPYTWVLAAEDDGNQRPGALDACFAVANRRVDANPLSPVLHVLLIVSSLRLPLKAFDQADAVLRKIQPPEVPR
jgi:hypothetical protein